MYLANFYRNKGDKDKLPRKSNLVRNLAIAGIASSGIGGAAGLYFLSKRKKPINQTNVIQTNAFKKDLSDKDLLKTYQKEAKKYENSKKAEKRAELLLEKDQENLLGLLENQNFYNNKRKTLSLEDKRFLQKTRKERGNQVRYTANQLRQQGLYFKTNIFLIEFSNGR